MTCKQPISVLAKDQELADSKGHLKKHRSTNLFSASDDVAMLINAEKFSFLDIFFDRYSFNDTSIDDNALDIFVCLRGIMALSISKKGLSARTVIKCEIFGPANLQ